MKECKAEGCSNKVFSHLYCKRHQYLREDDKWLTSKKNYNKSYNKVNIPDSFVLSDDNTKIYKSTKKKRKSSVGLYIKPERDYKTIYSMFFDIVRDDYALCEVNGCNRRMVDIHHIDNKGMAGSKYKDYIENLVGLCREHHDRAHRDKEFNKEVRIQHLINIIKKLKEEK